MQTEQSKVDRLSETVNAIVMGLVAFRPEATEMEVVAALGYLLSKTIRTGRFEDKGKITDQVVACLYKTVGQATKPTTLKV